MKKALLTFVAVLSGLLAGAQTDNADKLYNNWDYSGAAQLYEKDTTAHPTQDVFFKLGECYRKMGNYPGALKAYDRVNSSGAYTNPSFYLYYGWMLKTAERYDDAKTAFKKYEDAEPQDPSGLLYYNSCDAVVEDHKGDVPLVIKNVSSLNTPNSEFCPVLAKNGMVFTSDRQSAGHNKVDVWTGNHFMELFYAQKDNDTSFEKTYSLDDTVNIKYHDGPATFSKNFDTIYFSRVDKTLKGKAKKNPGIERSKLYYALWKERTWGQVTPFFANSDDYSITHPCLSHDGSRLYFASDILGGKGGYDIYYCTRKTDGSWNPPVNAGPNINTAGNEGYPSIDSAGDLYFSSDGYAGFGGLDICVSKFVNGEFTKAVPLKCPINSSGDDFGLVFLKDGKTGYFSSNRSGGKGSDDIYYFDMGPDKNLTTDIYIMGYNKVSTPVAMEPVKKVDTMKVDTIKTAPVSSGSTPVAVESGKNPDSVKASSLQPTVTPSASLDLHINFDVDKFTLRADAIAKLNEIVAYLQKNTDQMVQVNGYTDVSGQELYNQALSNFRANAAAQYIINKGIEKSRVRTVGFGPHPLILNEGVYDRVKEEVNRRVQFQWLPLNSTVASAPVYAPAGYSIQIVATPTEVPDNSPDFKGLKGIYHIKYENGLFCYYYGFYTTSADADKGLKEVADKGILGTIIGLSNKIK